ncbi:hypothetical protein BH23ACI1_BH23ACI1_23270 [soil metagenome]
MVGVRRYFEIPLGTRLIVAFAAGAAVGLLMGPAATIVAPASRLLAAALKPAPLVWTPLAGAGHDGSPAQ